MILVVTIEIETSDYNRTCDDITEALKAACGPLSIHRRH